MQIKINGEQPFQVLGTNFTIGPSQSGYDLYFSADGTDYSQLFSVGAGVNRQVTQVAAGSYYKLVGNTGELTVNWMRECGNGSGSGGSYTLPVASQNTLGGIKVGNGLSIDSNGTLSSEGGAGSYTIVDALSAITSPTEGLMATVKTTTYPVVWHKVQIGDINEFPNEYGRPEGWVAKIHWGDWNGESTDDLVATNIYQSSENFYWDWENDGNAHRKQIERDGYWGEIEYKTFNDGNDNVNSYFLWRQISAGNEEWGDLIMSIENGASASTVTETVIKPGNTYVYRQGAWTPANAYQVPYNGFSTSAETIAFAEKINADYARGVYSRIYFRGLVLDAVGVNENTVVFATIHGGYNTLWTLYFSGANGTFNDNNFNAAGFRFDIQNFINLDFPTLLGGVRANGANYSDLDELKWNWQGILYRYGLRFSNPDNVDEIWGVGLLNWWYRYKVEAENDEGWEWYYVISAQIPVDTTIYTGVWGWTDNSNIETLEWTSGSTYESQTRTKYVEP